MCVRRIYYIAFWSAAGFAFLVPAAILSALGKSAGRWLANDPTYTLWCGLLFPLAIAAFSCYMDRGVLRAAVRHRQWGTFLRATAICGVVIVAAIVYADVTDLSRPPLPYYFRQPLSTELDKLHQQILNMNIVQTGKAASDTSEVKKLKEQYRQMASHTRPETAAYYVLIVADCVYGTFAAFVIWYLLAHRVAITGPLDLLHNKHLMFVALVFSLWFPCRLYSEWYLRFGAVEDLKGYETIIVAAAAIIMGIAFILACSWAGTELVSTLKKVAVAVGTVLGAIVALKPEVVRKTLAFVLGMNEVTKLVLMSLISISMIGIFILIHDPDPTITTDRIHTS